jgi:hypothetical protein
MEPGSPVGGVLLQRLIFCQKHYLIIFKVNFVVKRQLSALISMGWLATDNF